MPVQQQDYHLMKQKKKTILIVDDHPIMREGICQIINNQNDLEVIAQAESSLEALRILKELDPDMAIVDISLKGMNGLELTREIIKYKGHMPILILSMHPETFYAERAIKAGAMGYIQKHEPSAKLIKAIRKILSGKIHLSPEISQKLLLQISASPVKGQRTVTDSLSDREFEAFRFIGRGMKPRQIADELFVSVKTVETYYSRIKRKLNLGSASELREFAINYFRDQQGSS